MAAPYAVLLAPAARRDLATLPKDVQRRVTARPATLAQDPRPAGSRELAGTDFYRIRVGDYCAIYRVDDEVLTVTVVRIGHRGHRVYVHLDVL